MSTEEKKKKRVVRITDFVSHAMGSVNFRDFASFQKDTIKSVFLEFVKSLGDCDNYYFILHDDTDILHIHYYLHFPRDKRKRCITICNKARDILNLDINAIFCDKCSSPSSWLRYVLHLTKESQEDGKKEYEVDDLVTDFSLEIINSMLNSVKGAIDFDYLVSVVLSCTYDSDIMEKLTIPVFHKYRYEIDVIKQDRSHLLLKSDDMKKEEDDLPW